MPSFFHGIFILFLVVSYLEFYVLRIVLSLCSIFAFRLVFGIPIGLYHQTSLSWSRRKNLKRLGGWKVALLFRWAFQFYQPMNRMAFSILPFFLFFFLERMSNSSVGPRIFSSWKWQCINQIFSRLRKLREIFFVFKGFYLDLIQGMGAPFFSSPLSDHFRIS